MATQNQSDIISLVQDISNFFSLNEIQPINDDSYNLLLNGKPINIDEKDYSNNYLSFIFVVYKNKYYPVLFYKVKQITRTSISIMGNPIFAKPTLNLLSRIGIDEDEIHKSNDINSVVISLLGLIEKKELEIKLCNGLAFFSPKDLLTQDVFDYLSGYIYSTSKSKIDTLIKNESTNPNLDLDFFNFPKEINLYTKQNKVSKVIFSNEKLSDYFIKSLISLNMLEGGISILVNSEEEKKDYIKEFRKIFGHNFVYDLSDYHDRIKNKKEINIKNELTLKDIKANKEYELFKEVGNKYFESIQRVEGIYKKNKLKDIKYDVSKGNNKSLSFNLDPTSYTRNNFNSDTEFFANIKDLKSIFDTPITLHPFYGFNEKYTENDYLYIKQLIKEIIKCLNDLRNLLDKSSLRTLNELRINSFKDLEGINEVYNFLSSCRSIPIEYFDKDFSEEQSQIEELKTLFHKLSASKLVIQNLAIKEIFSLDLLSIINDCHSKNLITKFKAYRLILNYSKIKKKRSVFPLVKVIEKYAFSQARVNELLPKYEEKYGSKVSTLSGLKEIENLYLNISKFKEYTKMDKSFSTSNIIIKNLLTNSNFEKSFSSDLKLAMSLYNECKNRINVYINYFLFDQRDFISSTIENNINFFNKKLDGKLSDLTDYISYISLLKDASPTLINAINKCVENNVSLSNLSEFFFTSLINLNYSESRKEISLFKNEMDKNKHNYLSSLSKIDLFKSIENRFVAFSKQEGVDSYNSINSDRTIENELICVATIDDLVGIGDNKLRNLIVYDKTNYENTVILDLLRLADCVYFVEEQNCINQFTMNCIIGDFSTISLLNNQFDFSKLNKDTIKELSILLKNKHLKLVKEDFFYIIDERKKTRYLLIPSSCLSGPIVSRELNEAFNFISIINTNKIMYLDVIKFDFNKKEAFKEMLLPYYR